MKLFYIIFLISMCLNNTSEIKDCHIYLTPRNVNYGWADNGVLKFKFNKQNIKVPYEYRRYNPKMAKDSVFELFFVDTKIKESLIFRDTILDSRNYNFNKRILILLFRNKTDSIFIDREYRMIYNNKSYFINDSLKSYLINIMPEDIKSNWINNIPPP